MTTANKAMWIRAAWDCGHRPQYDDIMVGVDGDKVIIHRLHNPSERIVISRKDWAKLFWPRGLPVKNQIEQGEPPDEDAEPAGEQDS